LNVIKIVNILILFTIIDFIRGSKKAYNQAMEWGMKKMTKNNVIYII